MVDPTIAEKTQDSVAVIMSQPISIIAAFLWVLGIAILITWWATRRVGQAVTGSDLAAAIQTAGIAIEKKIDDHKHDDERMFQETAERYQRGMEMASEKFVDGMRLAGDYLKKVTEEQQVIREKSDGTANDFTQIKGALKALLPEDVAKKIFQEAS